VIFFYLVTLFEPRNHLFGIDSPVAKRQLFEDPTSCRTFSRNDQWHLLQVPAIITGNLGVISIGRSPGKWKMEKSETTAAQTGLNKKKYNLGNNSYSTWLTADCQLAKSTRPVSHAVSQSTSQSINQRSADFSHNNL